MGARFSVAMRFNVARAFSWFPVSTSYRALSGSHCSQPKKQTWQLIKLSIVLLTYRRKYHTHVTQDGEDEERNGGKAEQPTPAQCGHHQDGEEDLKHCAQCPKYLQGQVKIISNTARKTELSVLCSYGCMFCHFKWVTLFNNHH